MKNRANKSTQANVMEDRKMRSVEQESAVKRIYDQPALTYEDSASPLNSAFALQCNLERGESDQLVDIIADMEVSPMFTLAACVLPEPETVDEATALHIFAARCYLAGRLELRVQ